ncbi:sel1 repeat family protein [Zooshikella marina]|uniref:tetratricopeptide repeat protein n=1 Tax=Zooshikella ganghwensis TaxID=202772 RepID=UPI001BB05AAF|nr:sel1 repeat family protein [Zooshikella ganghwensis]MBU2709265.1 sel1 repeat family protein [Zooshikella ganghwensis]
MKSIKVLLVLMCCSFANAQETVTEKAFQKSEAWLLPVVGCPADMMPKVPVNVDYDKELCRNDINKCLDECKKDKVAYCYNLAQHIQITKLNNYEKYAEALFVKSCRLGSPSGCTNSAATMQHNSDDAVLSCAIRTYSKACDWNDPWACTMYGFHLAHGKGIKQDFEKALKVLGKSCKYGSEDPACESATALTESINKAMGNHITKD